MDGTLHHLGAVLPRTLGSSGGARFPPSIVLVVLLEGEVVDYDERRV